MAMPIIGEKKTPSWEEKKTEELWNVWKCLQTGKNVNKDVSRFQTKSIKRANLKSTSQYITYHGISYVIWSRDSLPGFYVILDRRFSFWMI